MEQVGTERAIQERSPGRWAIVLEVRDEATGKRKRRWHSFKGTKRQAQDECARLITDLKNGNALEPNKTTVAQFLERWLDHIRTQVSPKSHERYAGIVHQNLIPALGAVRLNKLCLCRYQQPTLQPSSAGAGTAPVGFRRERWDTCTGY
jgi:hypothetical protein